MPRSKRILLILDIARGTDRALVNGIVEYAHLRGDWSFDYFGPLFRSQPFFGGEREDLISRLRRLDADGMVGYIPDDKALLKTIISSGFPTVAIPVTEPIKGVINIWQDENVGTLGADHFLDRGYKQFAFCGTVDHWSQVRMKGYAQQIHMAGYELSVYPAEKDTGTKSLQKQNMAQWLHGLPKPIGVMCSNDERGCDLAEVCHEENLKIPEQVGILGVDNDEIICNMSNPLLSSIKLNGHEVGYKSAEILDRLIQRNPTNTTAPCFYAIGLVTRQSTDILAINDANVVAAVKYIRRNARKNISVQDVVAETTLSTRALQQRFKATLERTIHQEIRRVRTEQLKHMLLNTNQSIHSIGRDLGFRDVDHISRLFRRETGMSPLDFRKRFAPR